MSRKQKNDKENEIWDAISEAGEISEAQYVIVMTVYNTTDFTACHMSLTVDILDM